MVKLQQIGLIHNYFAEDTSFSLRPLLSEWLRSNAKLDDHQKWQKLKMFNAMKARKSVLDPIILSGKLDYELINLLQALLLHAITCQETLRLMEFLPWLFQAYPPLARS
jgi:hypothetical protein